MKKPASPHLFDHAGRAFANYEHLETEFEKLRAENERLRRIIVLQERRWRGVSGPNITKH